VFQLRVVATTPSCSTQAFGNPYMPFGLRRLTIIMSAARMSVISMSSFSTWIGSAGNWAGKRSMKAT